jgi:acetaldehyde dehydrogenase
MRCGILGTGNIGIDLSLKLRKNKKNKISVFNLNPNSNGAKYCKSKKLDYSSKGIKDVIKNLDNLDIIFDTTNSESNLKHYKLLKTKKKFLINLTPSKIGNFYIPYIDEKKSLKSKSFNLITCGGQSSIPIIFEISKKIRNIKYIEIVSAISSKSAGMATRANINEYLDITSKAVKQYTGIKNVKIILNINPGEPPVNMSNSLYFEFKKNLSNSNIKEVRRIISKINKKMSQYAKGFNSKFIGQLDDNILKVKIEVMGDGDYLPKYSGNLDIITNMAKNIVARISKEFSNN